MPKKTKCLRCGYVWQSRVDKPKACPECKTRTWNKLARSRRKQPTKAIH